MGSRMHRRRKQRQNEALSREMTRVGRSDEDQMDLISTRRGNSRREMSKLVKIHIPER